ncbi:MAG: HEAT repeat domain-containing protein, partial [Gemmatimonadales bacterium]
MSRSLLLVPWLAVTTLSAQVPTRPPTPPRPAPPPRVTVRPTPAPVAPIFMPDMPDMPIMPEMPEMPIMPDMPLDWNYHFDTGALQDYAWQAQDYARKASDLAMQDMSLKFNTLSDVNINLGGMGWGDSYGGGPTRWVQGDPADSLYRSARDQLNRGDYRKAAGLFKSLPQKYPSSAYVADAEYWEAFSLYRIGGTPELQEALAVLDARKVSPDEASDGKARGNPGNGGFGVVATSGYSKTPMNGFIYYRGQTDAAGLAARIASVLSTRGLSNDPAVKRALAAAGSNTCDQEEQSVRAEALDALMHNDPATGRQMAVKILSNRDECSVPLRRNAVMLVGNEHDDAAVTTLLPVAKTDPSPAVRMSAVEYLVQQQSDAAVNAVIDVARSDTSSQMQRIAIRALSQSSSPRARAEVRTMIENNNANEALRISAIDGLDRDRMTADDAAWLRTVYARTTSPRVKERILMAVGRSGGDAANQWLLEVIKNDDEPLETRSEALRYAGRTMDIATLDKIVDTAKRGTDPQRRREAISILARSQDPRASNLLLQLVDRTCA